MEYDGKGTISERRCLFLEERERERERVDGGRGGIPSSAS
jgi:hypothetical protein